MQPLSLDLNLFPDSLRSERSALEKHCLETLKSIANGSFGGGKWTGWFDYPEKVGYELASKIKNFCSRVDVDYDVVLTIGIGGSYLGTRAADQAIGSRESTTIAYLGHHLSERATFPVLELINQRKPIVNVISKSGTTTEPSVAFRLVREAMERRFGKDEAKQRIVATTDPETGALRALANQQGYQCFEVPPDIGGRYSVLSAVGLVPLALARHPINEILDGANQLFSELRSLPAEHPAISYASARTAWYQSGKKIEILSYNEPDLHYVGEWWKQLYGESEGKNEKGLFPASMTFTTDLHSLGQYAQQGERHLIETFLSFRNCGTEQALRVPSDNENLDGLNYLSTRRINEINQAAMQATQIAHHDGGVGCMGIELKKLDPFHLGYLFAFFESSCALSGDLIGVDPFNQPGVEDYKRNLFAILGKPGFEDLASKLKPRLEKMRAN